MLVLAVASTKGGVGKSTTSMNLAGELARNGKKVLIWDFDPQASVTQMFKIDLGESFMESADIVGSDKTDPKQAIVELSDNLFLIPATFELGYHDGLLLKGDNILRLKRAIAKVSTLGFDYIIIDPPGSGDVFMRSVLVAAESLLIPVRPTDADFSALHDFGSVIQDIKERYNPGLQVKGILINQVNATSKTQDIYRSFLKGHEWEGLVMDTSIRMATSVGTSPGQGKDVITADPKSKVASEYRKLAKEVMSWQ